MEADQPTAPQMSNIWDVLYERRSIRSFERGRIMPQDVKGRILDSARYALPTVDGDYPWRFVIVDDKTINDMLGDCGFEVSRRTFGSSFESFYSNLWYMPPETRIRVAEYTTTGELWRYPEDASMVTIPCLREGGLGLAGQGGLLPTSKELAPHIGFAAENMWLTAKALGIGAGYNMMALNDGRRTEIIGSYLGIPRSWILCGAYCFGYSTSPRTNGPSRAVMEGLVFSEKWGNNWERIAFRGEGEGIRIPEVNVFDTIKGVAQFRNFEPGRVDDWMIERMLDTAIWGPNPENYKHHRYVVIRDKKSIDFLHRIAHERGGIPLMSNLPEASYSRLWFLPSEEEKMAYLEKEYNQGPGEWYESSDAVILAMSSRRVTRPGTIRFGDPPVFETATGCCIQNMLLSANAMGLGTNWDTLFTQDERAGETVHEYFGIPGSWRILGALSVGRPGEKIPQAPPPPVKNLVFDNYWGAHYAEEPTPI